jgi:hypothetical protein
MPSAWITHVKKYAAENNVSYKEALSKASASYKKGSGICGSEYEEPTQPTQRTRQTRRTLTASNRNPPEPTNTTPPVNNRPPRLRRGIDIDENIDEETSSQLERDFNNLNQLSSRSSSLEGNGKKKRDKGRKKKNSYISRIAKSVRNELRITNYKNKNLN